VIKNKILFLYEEILLLALKDEKGTIAVESMFAYAIGGAILAELLLRKCITIDRSPKKKLVSIVNGGSIGDPLLDECLQKIATAKRPANLETWVSRFAGLKNLKHRVAQQLVNHGILHADEGKILLIFSRKIYPEINPEPERKIIKRLHKAIFEDGEDIDSRTIVLLSLANSSNLLNMVFDKKELKSRKKRIQQIVNGEIAGKAAKEAIEAIEAMQAAVMVAAIMPAIMASSFST
jgi:Golgi phosphoprotein 3